MGQAVDKTIEWMNVTSPSEGVESIVQSLLVPLQKAEEEGA
jgi:hypothetical protein